MFWRPLVAGCIGKVLRFYKTKNSVYQGNRRVKEYGSFPSCFVLQTSPEWFDSRTAAKTPCCHAKNAAFVWVYVLINGYVAHASQTFC